MAHARGPCMPQQLPARRCACLCAGQAHTHAKAFPNTHARHAHGTHTLARTRAAQVRAELGLAPDARLAVLIHGGHKAELSVTRDFLPAGWVCVACNGGRPLGPDPLPPNFQLAPADVYTPDLVAACDCVIGKIGYGCGATRCTVLLRSLRFALRV